VRPGLTLFVPVLNEEAILASNLEHLLAQADRLGRELQLIVVDNGSTDATPRILSRMAARDPRLRWLRLPEPGVGAALAAALPHVQHEALVAIDVDLTIDLAFLDNAARELDSGADIVVGSKLMGKERRPLLRVAASRLFSFVCVHGLGLAVHDASIGAKAYRTSVLRRHAGLIGRGSTYVLEILVRAADEGLDVREVPVACDDRRASRFNLVSEGFLRFGHQFALVARHQARRFLPALAAERRPAAASAR
jgi:glycosyltransferase involved in cell wall biosynthesis